MTPVPECYGHRHKKKPECRKCIFGRGENQSNTKYRHLTCTGLTREWQRINQSKYRRR